MSPPPTSVTERAHAKVNLVLRVGPSRADGLHPLCSLFAALALHDEVTVTADPSADGDVVDCPGVDGDNLAAAAAAAFRAAVPGVELPPLRIEIEKRIPVAAGLAGGSADAAAVLRAANTLAGGPLGPDELRAVAAGLGSDVPSQVEPAHAVVSGVGERVERVELPPLALVLLPRAEGLSTAAVYAEADRIGRFATDLDPAPLHRLAARARAQADAAPLAAALANDLQPAALALAPELEDGLAALRDAGALAAQVSGSGPTVFGLFADRVAADSAALALAGVDRAAPPIAPPGEPAAAPAPIVTELHAA
ncbi:MAG: 4-(cytidine 5'-diphospho)-2-C-methyl-D-erythritol kinase [Solirubrobacterales bacterium]|nr:4-(cytidine 5'-diphospho)-2-C-methyl-D-erythritol kinase [Solirubrobacterales bacterium]